MGEDSCLKMGNLKFKCQTNERVTDSSRSTLGYTFSGHINFSIDKTQEKYSFSNRNSLGSPPPAITFQQM